MLKTSGVITDWDSHRQTIGAAQGKGILPTSSATDILQIGGREIEATICDVGNITVFISSYDAGVSCTETPEEITGNSGTIARLREIRGKAAQLLGRCSDWKSVDTESPMLPLVALVSPDQKGEGHVSARLILDNKCHESMAGTGAICMAACSRVPSSVVNRLMTKTALADSTFKIRHALGVMPVTVLMEIPTTDKAPEPVFQTLSFVRTSRRIMTGSLHIPDEFIQEGVVAHPEVTNHAQDNEDHKEGESITETLCNFVAKTTFDTLQPHLVPKLTELLLDHIGIASSAAFNSESSAAFMAGIQSLNGTGGGATVYTKGKSFSPPFAALLNGSFAHTFDFDDTMAAGVLHPGVAVIPAALAASEATGASGRELLTGLAVGYEVACRIGRALGTGGYSRGFHNTGTAGILGAVAAVSSIRGLSATQVEDAFGLAVSKAAGSMQYLDNGSWNKRLHPGFAAHDSFLCVSLAESGVVGASRSIEGEYGFLHAYSDNANPAGVLPGLGTEWIFTATALKPFPACRMTHTAIDVTARVAAEQEVSGIVPKKIAVRLSPPCYRIVGVPSENKRYPRTTVDAQFSIYYQIAVAWLFGCDVGWAAYDKEKMEDPTIRDICARIDVSSDEDMVDLEVRMTFFGLGDGAEREERMVHPLGEKENPFSRERVRAKFVGLATPVFGSDGAEEIVRAVNDLTGIGARDLMSLLEAPSAH